MTANNVVEQGTNSSMSVDKAFLVGPGSFLPKLAQMKQVEAEEEEETWKA